MESDVAKWIDVDRSPSGTGCADCLAAAGWWLHLRRCATCGHIGCCDSSPGQHASTHAAGREHPVMRSFEPGEDWFYDARTGEFFTGPELAEPAARPRSQPAPAPSDRVPEGWMDMLHR
ncbi:MAG: UBP-type zinc finger domain-containing protein [Nocardioides sp.]